MLCFEVYRNGKKLCTAGVGDFGVLSAHVTWVSHSPEKLACWIAEGVPETEPTSLFLTVGGLVVGDSDSAEHLKWVKSDLVTGDEIRICVVDVPSADSPSKRYQEDPARIEEQKKDYVRKTAKELGWTIGSEPDCGDSMR